jgi:hypothetical protein
MDLLTTILTCSLYASDDALVRAIAEGPSGGNPYLVVDTAAGASQDEPTPAPRNQREATARAAELRAQGAPILLGLLELPPSWLDAFGRPLASAFDPCVNVAIGTAMLSEFDAACASKVLAADARSRMLERTNRRACVLRTYEAAIGSTDFADAIWLELSAQVPKAPSIEDAPIFAPPTARDWGPDKILVPMVVAPAPRASGARTSP